MLSYIKQLYNLGDNNGDLVIKTKDDHIVKCHSFVMLYASDSIKMKLLKEDVHDAITLNYNKQIVDIVLNYLYSEKILESDLDINDVLDIFSLIHDLRMNNCTLELKNYYSRLFVNYINKNNWIHVLKSIYKLQKYSELYDCTLEYIKTVVLLDNDSIMDIQKSDIDNDIKCVLFDISLNTLQKLNDEISEYRKKKDDARKQLMNKVIKGSDDYESESSEESEPKPKKMKKRKAT